MHIPRGAGFEAVWFWARGGGSSRGGGGDGWADTVGLGYLRQPGLLSAGSAGYGQRTGSHAGRINAQGVNSEYRDPNPQIITGPLDFRTITNVEHVPAGTEVPASLTPFYGGKPGSVLVIESEVAGMIVAQAVAIGPVTLEQAGVFVNVKHIVVTLELTIYYNSSHPSYAGGQPRLQTQWAEYQHARDMYEARDSEIVPFLSDRLARPVLGLGVESLGPVARAINSMLRRALESTRRAYDFAGGPHNGGPNPVPDDFTGFPPPP